MHMQQIFIYISKNCKPRLDSVFAEATGIEENPPVRYNIRIQNDAVPAHVKPFRFTEI